jgi:RimJ/RimL family protein N-acetyltransferase
VFVTVRNFTEADIPVRTALLRESHFQANLSDFAVAADDASLEVKVRATMESYHDRRIFTMCAPGGDIIGFSWITSIDWRNQTCELSFGVLPRYRGGLGALAVEAAHTYLREELNMRAIVNQVLEHNTMLQSAEMLAASKQVRCDFDSFTVGRWRATCYWSLTEEDAKARLDERQKRRRELADRIRTRKQELP